ncbi:methyltransferase [Novosphingobium sp. Chol11]|uniref:class I SAM-dependent methyltransferase n=1 Tax=Novosphingobium sp. Chol11 TaxID=1385763 RepID=UPI0025F16B0F|nr:methyltransferase [Novosphingobium sp. Chol11]
MNNNVFSFPALAIIALALSAATISNAARPADDIARDAARKPAAMITFAKVKPGKTVVDMLPGGGYFTRIFSKAVGPKGHVIALVPDQFAKAYPKAAAAVTALGAEPAYKNVEVAIRALTDVAPAGTADVVWTAQNYHDLHSAKLPPQTIAAVNAAVFAALKPGGFYIILDHSAAAGSGMRDVDTLHRIDAEALKAEVIAAGFTFDGESKVLANAADDRSKNVFDPAIRGKSDQFVYRFMKPKS